VVILALDSASCTGWALLEGERLIGRGTVDASDLLRLEAFARNACAQRRPDLVVIEDNFVMRGKKANPNTMKILSRIVGAWLLAFAVRGVATEIVMPNIWQRGVLGKIAKGGTKKAAALWVRATFGVDANEDECDAIGLACWVARREMLASRLLEQQGRMAI